MGMWEAYSEENGYGAALIGNGPQTMSKPAITRMEAQYKLDECTFYEENDIWKTFWWSN